MIPLIGLADDIPDDVTGSRNRVHYPGYGALTQPGVTCHLWYIDSAPYIELRVNEDALPTENIHSLDQPLQHQHTVVPVLRMHLVRLVLAQREVSFYAFWLVRRQQGRVGIAGMDKRWQGSRVIAVVLQTLDGAIF